MSDSGAGTAPVEIAPPSPATVRRLGAAFFLVAAVAMFTTESDYGLASDVGNYFYSSLRQLAWLQEFLRALLSGSPGEALAPDHVADQWRWMLIRVPHPPLSREISGLGWLVFRNALGDVTAYRVGVMVTYSALAGGCAAFTAGTARSLLAGVGAGLGILLIPVLFAHGHFAHTDLFLSAFWFGSAACLYAWTENPGMRSLVMSGLLLGAALATKFTGLLAVPVLGIWLVLTRPRRLVPAVVVLGLAAALVFVASNPVMWTDPATGISDYLGAGVERSADVLNQIRTLYFGTLYVYRGPWHYPFVWTLIVLPPTILIAILAGLFDSRNSRLAGFCVLNAAVLYLALMVPSAPMHDGVRLILPAFPFFAVLGGLGTARIAAGVARLPMVRGEVGRLVPGLLVVFAIFLPALAAVVRTHPFQLSYVNLFVGGVAGAERRGLEITNIKDVLSQEVLDDLADVIPGGSVIDPGFLLEEICFNQTLGRAPRDWVVETRWPSLIEGDPDLVLACEGTEVRAPTAIDRQPREPAYLLQYARRAMWRPIDWAVHLQGDRPAYELSVEGVPLLRVFRLR